MLSNRQLSRCWYVDGVTRAIIYELGTPPRGTKRAHISLNLGRLVV